MRSLLVVVHQVPVQGTLQATPPDAPAAAETLALSDAHPAFGDGVEVGTERREGDRLNATAGQCVLPRQTELAVRIRYLAPTWVSQSVSAMVRLRAVWTMKASTRR